MLESIVRAYETKLRLIAARQMEANAAIDMLTLLGPDEPLSPASDTALADNEQPNEAMP